MLLSHISMFVNSFVRVFVPPILFILTSNLSLPVGINGVPVKVKIYLTTYEIIMSAYLILVDFFLQNYEIRNVCVKWLSL